MHKLAVVFALALAVSGCEDPDKYSCQQSKPCSHAEDAARHRAYVEEQKAAHERYEANRPERERQQAKIDANLNAWYARITPQELAYALARQRQSDAIDHYNEATHTLKQCSPYGCW